MTERNSHTMRKRLLAVSLAAIVPFSLAGVASAADGQYLLAPPSGPAGTVVTASDADGDCAVPVESADPFVIFVIASDQGLLDDNDADLTSAGTFSLTATSPAGTPAGTYNVFVECYRDRAAFEEDDPFELEEKQNRVLASYEADGVNTAYVETLGVGENLPPMPLFIAPGAHVLVPLEETYLRTWDDSPKALRRLVE